MKLFDLDQLALADLVLTLKSFAISWLLKSILYFSLIKNISKFLFAHKWVTGKPRKCLISVKSRLKILYIRSKVLQWVVYFSQNVLFMKKMIVWKVLFAHKNELLGTNETIWSLSTLIAWPCTYAHKFRNHFLTKVKISFICKHVYVQNSICAQKITKIGKLWNIWSQSTRVGRPRALRSKVLQSVVYYSQFLLSMRLQKFSFAHRNASLENDETVCCQSSRISRPSSFGQKFWNELFA